MRHPPKPLSITRPTRSETRRVTRRAISRGVLTRPDSCEECRHEPTPLRNGKTVGVHAHHPDYNQPLRVIWLCRACHRDWHREHTAIPIVGEIREEPGLQVNITDPLTARNIRRAILSFGFPKVGTGVTLILLVFARSERVRTAVRRALGVHAPTPIEES